MFCRMNLYWGAIVNKTCLCRIFILAWGPVYERFRKEEKC
jgi:hypothetical protein